MDFDGNGVLWDIIFRLSTLRKFKYPIWKAIIPSKFLILQTWNSRRRSNKYEVCGI